MKALVDALQHRLELLPDVLGRGYEPAVDDGAVSLAQQLVRRMSNEMISVAVENGRAEAALAEIESLGPHGTADALAELLAADRSGGAPEMLRLRAAFHRHLTTVPEDLRGVPCGHPC